MTTEAPRTRYGKVYPGGRHMRRALRILQQRREGDQQGRPSDHGHNRKGGAGVTVAGSMKA